ncbi:MAG: hypothetical protein L6R39_006507 [Caloplaca ligustica]|nr:MAG: hypothetical protein L6R39_006507 [Caloplaca ligustica]
MDPCSPPSAGQSGEQTPHEKTLLVERTTTAVKEYMSQPHFDASHDFAHVRRVLALTEHILQVEGRADPIVEYDATAARLAALLHDVDDRKYTEPKNDSFPSGTKIIGAARMLLDLGCSAILALDVQAIIDCVSYTRESKDPQLVQETLRTHPELAIVQDADRLDALGAVGIARAFVYGAAKDRERGLEGTLIHFDEKLLGLEGLMKTREGKRLAKIRTERLKQFKEWWKDETNGVN